MTRRIRNLILFVAAAIGTALLLIGIVALIDGDESGWRAIIGSAFAFALTLVVGLRAQRQRRLDT